MKSGLSKYALPKFVYVPNQPSVVALCRRVFFVYKPLITLFKYSSYKRNTPFCSTSSDFTCLYTCFQYEPNHLIWDHFPPYPQSELYQVYDHIYRFLSHDDSIRHIICGLDRASPLHLSCTFTLALNMTHAKFVGGSCWPVLHTELYQALWLIRLYFLLITVCGIYKKNVGSVSVFIFSYTFVMYV
jgi:hypothetical protein